MVSSTTKLFVLRERVVDEGGLQRPKGSSPQDTKVSVQVCRCSQDVNSLVNSSSVVAVSSSSSHRTD